MDIVCVALPIMRTVVTTDTDHLLELEPKVHEDFRITNPITYLAPLLVESMHLPALSHLRIFKDSYTQ